MKRMRSVLSWMRGGCRYVLGRLRRPRVEVPPDPIIGHTLTKLFPPVEENPFTLTED